MIYLDCREEKTLLEASGSADEFPTESLPNSTGSSPEGEVSSVHPEVKR